MGGIFFCLKLRRLMDYQHMHFGEFRTQPLNLHESHTLFKQIKT